MRIMVLPRYSEKGASSRYRLWQYIPGLRKAGHEIRIRSLVGDGYLEQLYGTGRRDFMELAFGYAKRLADVLAIGGYDAVVCEQEMFPYLPASFESVVRRCGARLILDYDDAAYCKYEKWPVLRYKITGLMSYADTVVVGNHELAEYARKVAAKVEVIPTVIDLTNYRQCKAFRRTDCVRIGWIGTPITAEFLRPLIPQLSELQAKYPFLSVRLIGAGDYFSDTLRAETVGWSAESEAQLLNECDIGIMPLPETKFTRAKCGLKIIQYMASGLPVVASAVGVNRTIVEEGRNGFLAVNDWEWFEKLDILVRNADLRKRLGQAGRAKVVSMYSLEYGLRRWLAVLEGVSARRMSL